MEELGNAKKDGDGDRAHGGPQQPKCRKHTNPIVSAMREDLLTRLCMSGSFGGGIGGIIKIIQNILI